MTWCNLSRFRGSEVAVKSARDGSHMGDRLEQEHAAYHQLQSLQGSCIPKLLYYGHDHSHHDILLIVRYACEE